MKQPSSTRKSQFVRTLDYFRTAAIEEAAACLQSATEIIVNRADPLPQRAARRTRKVRTNGAVDSANTPTQGDNA